MYIESSVHNTQLNNSTRALPTSLHTTRLENDPLQSPSACLKEQVMASTRHGTPSLVTWSHFTVYLQPLESGGVSHWVVFSLCIVCIFNLSSVLYFPASTNMNGTV